MNKSVYIVNSFMILWSTFAFANLEDDMKTLQARVKTLESREQIDQFESMKNFINENWLLREKGMNNQLRRINALLEEQDKKIKKNNEVLYETRKQLAEAKDNQGITGEIRYSILDLQQFQQLYGSSWVLMDGKEVPGTHLASLGITNIPDARGIFLRCKDHSRGKEGGNPAGDLAVGTYQEDQIKEHNHKTKIKGQIFFSRLKPDCEFVNGFTPGPAFTGPCPRFDTGITRDGIPDTSESGGDETRPRCVTVNAFIKIHDTRNLPEKKDDKKEPQNQASEKASENSGS